MRNSNFKRAGFVCLLLFSLLLSASAQAKPPKILLFEPDPEAETEEGAKLRDGEHWLFEQGGVTLLVTRLQSEQRTDYLSKHLGLTADPFASRPGQPERYLTFVFVIENRTEGPITFNPRSAWLRTNRNKVQSPIALTDLSFDYRVMGGELPPAFEKVRGVLYENSLQVLPGESISGLLAYRPVPEHTKRFKIDLRVMAGRAEVIPFAASYRLIKTKKRKKRSS